MKVLIAGGLGFIGSALTDFLRSGGHQVWILTRRSSSDSNEIRWDGKTPGRWVERIDEMDAVVNLTGFGLEHWPWTKAQKKRFIDSRVLPGRALASAIEKARRRPNVFLQISGINYYGTKGDEVADEQTPAAGDYLAQLAVHWEDATKPIEEMGVRRVIARSAVVLDSHAGLFPLMALPVRLFAGGPIGDGKQAVPWIHLADQIGALSFLLKSGQASGAFNLISPTPTSNAEFMRVLARALHRPYWFRTPAFFLEAFLGEMSTLVTEGRYSSPKRLLESGYQFRFPTVDAAFQQLFG
jgi:uncharacterized protein